MGKMVLAVFVALVFLCASGAVSGHGHMSDHVTADHGKQSKSHELHTVAKQVPVAAQLDHIHEEEEGSEDELELMDPEMDIPEGVVPRVITSEDDLTSLCSLNHSQLRLFEEVENAVRALETDLKQLTRMEEEEEFVCGSDSCVSAPEPHTEEDSEPHTEDSEPHKEEDSDLPHFSIDNFKVSGREIIVITLREGQVEGWNEGEGWALFHSTATSNLAYRGETRVPKDRYHRHMGKPWYTLGRDELVKYINWRHGENTAVAKHHINQIRGIRGYFPWKGKQGLDNWNHAILDWAVAQRYYERHPESLRQANGQWFLVVDTDCGQNWYYLEWMRKCMYGTILPSAALQLRRIEQAWLRIDAFVGADIYRRWNVYWSHCDMPPLLVCVALTLEQDIPQNFLDAALTAGGCPNGLQNLVQRLYATGNGVSVGPEPVSVADINNRLQDNDGVNLEWATGWLHSHARTFRNVGA